MRSLGVLFFGTDDTYPLPWYVNIPIKQLSQQIVQAPPGPAFGLLRRLGMQLNIAQFGGAFWLSGFAPVTTPTPPSYVQPTSIITVSAGQTQSINLSTGWVAVVYARSFTNNTSIVVNGQTVNLNQDPDGDGVYEVALAFMAEANETLVVTNNNATTCRVYVFNQPLVEYHTIQVGNANVVYPFLPRITVNPLYSVAIGIPGYAFTVGGAVSSLSALVTGWSPSSPPNVLIEQNTLVTRPQGGTLYVFFTVYNGNTSSISVSGTLVDQNGNTVATSSATVGATSTSFISLTFTPPSGYVLPNIGLFTLNLSVTVGTSTYTSSVPVIINQTDLLRLDIIESLLGTLQLPITLPSSIANLCFITHASVASSLSTAPTPGVGIGFTSICSGQSISIPLTVSVDPDIASLLPSSGVTVNVYAIEYELLSNGTATYLGIVSVGSASLTSSQPYASLTYSFTPSTANAMYLLGFYATLTITLPSGSSVCLAAAPFGILNTQALAWPVGWTPFSANLFITYPPALVSIYSAQCTYPYQLPTPVVTPFIPPQFTGKMEFHDVHLILPEVAIISPSTLQGAIQVFLIDRSKVPASATVTFYALLPSGPTYIGSASLSALPGGPPASQQVTLTIPSNATSGTCLTSAPCQVPGFAVATINAGWAVRTHTYPIMIVTAGTPLPKFRPFS
jgi:hypothetical protein